MMNWKECGRKRQCTTSEYIIYIRQVALSNAAKIFWKIGTSFEMRTGKLPNKMQGRYSCVNQFPVRTRYRRRGCNNNDN